jgi:hypothetical protein
MFALCACAGATLKNVRHTASGAPIRVIIVICRLLHLGAARRLRLANNKTARHQLFQPSLMLFWMQRNKQKPGVAAGLSEFK